MQRLYVNLHYASCDPGQAGHGALRPLTFKAILRFGTLGRHAAAGRAINGPRHWNISGHAHKCKHEA